MKSSLIAIAVSLAAGLATSQAMAQSTLIEDNIPAAPASSYQVETIADGLAGGYAIAFLPEAAPYDGDMLVALKDGTIRVIRNDEMLEAPVSGTPEVLTVDQAGMFDLVLHPDFAETGLVYMTYSHGTERENATRLARARYVPSETGGALEDFEPIFTASPMKQGGYHYGGRVAFIGDGTLLLTIGEGYRYMDQAQELDNHFGKIVRLNDDGSVPADNPFVDQEDALPEIWSYGHRNPQGLIYIAGTDTVLEHEHGPKGGDEVNIIEPGKNYGWPAITYGIDYSGASISPFTEMNGMEQPEIHFVPSIAPSGFTYYDGDKFPDWQGDLFIGALAHEHLRRVDLGADMSFGDQAELLADRAQRIRDVRTGPDGNLYVVTDGDGGAVLRLTPGE